MKLSSAFRVLPLFVATTIHSHNTLAIAAATRPDSSRTTSLRLRGARYFDTTTHSNNDRKHDRSLQTILTVTTKTSTKTSSGDFDFEGAPGIDGIEVNTGKTGKTGKTGGTGKSGDTADGFEGAPAPDGIDVDTGKTGKTGKSGDTSGGFEGAPANSGATGQVNVVPAEDPLPAPAAPENADNSDNDNAQFETNWVESFADPSRDNAPEVDFSQCTQGLMHVQKIDEDTGEMSLDYYLNPATGHCVVIFKACPSIFPADHIDYSECAEGCLLPGAPNPC